MKDKLAICFYIVALPVWLPVAAGRLMIAVLLDKTGRPWR
jgi:hypothetical protein